MLIFFPQRLYSSYSIILKHMEFQLLPQFAEVGPSMYPFHPLSHKDLQIQAPTSFLPSTSPSKPPTLRGLACPDLVVGGEDEY